MSLCVCCTICDAWTVGLPLQYAVQVRQQWQHVVLHTFWRTIITIFPTRNNVMLSRPLLYSERYDLAWPSAVPVNDNTPVEYSVIMPWDQTPLFMLQSLAAGCSVSVWGVALDRRTCLWRVLCEACRAVMSSQTRDLFCWLHLAFLWIIKEIFGGESRLLHL